MRSGRPWGQILGPLLPVPIGCWLLYKAIVSLNRSPPPMYRPAAEVAVPNQAMYPELTYRGIDFSPQTFARNATSRGWTQASEGTPTSGEGGRSARG